MSLRGYHGWRPEADRDPSIRSLVQTCKTYKVAQSVTVRGPDGTQVVGGMSGDTGQDRSGPEPEVWTKTFGKGRVFAMTFGHDLSAQKDPNYLRLLQNGISWDLGLPHEDSH